MTVGPRIVFVRFLTSESPKLVPWAAHSARVLVSKPSAVAVRPPSDGLVVWQLVSGNNRQLARGTQLHDTFEGARADASTVVESADRLTVDLVSEAGRGVYGWFLSLDDRPVATCARWYVSDRDRRHSIDLAVRSISEATLHEGARLTDPVLMAGDRVALR